MQFWALSFSLNWCFFLLLLANMLFKFKTLLYFFSLLLAFSCFEDQTLLMSWLKISPILLYVYSMTSSFTNGKNSLPPTLHYSIYWGNSGSKLPAFPSLVQKFLHLINMMQTHTDTNTLLLCFQTKTQTFVAILLLSHNWTPCCLTTVEVPWYLDHYKIFSNCSIASF